MEPSGERIPARSAPGTPEVHTPALAKPAVPGASWPTGERVFRKEWRGEKNRALTFSGPAAGARIVRHSDGGWSASAVPARG